MVGCVVSIALTTAGGVCRFGVVCVLIALTSQCGGMSRFGDDCVSYRIVTPFRCFVTSHENDSTE